MYMMTINEHGAEGTEAVLKRVFDFFRVRLIFISLMNTKIGNFTRGFFHLWLRHFVTSENTGFFCVFMSEIKINITRKSRVFCFFSALKLQLEYVPVR